MTKIDIFSGFLGAGKTTLIKKLLNEAYKGEKVVLIENEFGEIGIDGGFLKDAGIEITEMNSGCICCSLVGDFTQALKKVISEYSPDRILIEPSGVGKLSDVIKAVKEIDNKDVSLNSFTTVADAKKCKMYMKNFGEFYNDQIENANCIVLSHTAGIDEEKILNCVNLIRDRNTSAAIITTDWNILNGKIILEAMEGSRTLADDVKALEDEVKCHHEHHEHNHECECGHHHEHHEHNHECECGHHHHHAEEVFASMGAETTAKYSKEQITNILKQFEDSDKYGHILRAKGIVCSDNEEWIYFDYIPGEADVRTGSSDIIGKICVIGSNINQNEIKKLFNLSI
jgi:G3E family GTPase